jgi:hypothetical protein
MFNYIFAGGFLAGYRTYILSAVAVVTVASQYVLGDIGLATFIEQAALALGLSTVRAGAAAAVVNAAEAGVKAAETAAKP